jgi:GT2 family glycosyltransferase
MQELLKVAVVILNWNGKKYLEQFLPALLKTTYTNFEFYVADNHSSDHSVQMVKEKFPSVKIIEIAQNEGFAKGYNIALKQVQTDIYVLLNQDVEVTPDWIQPVVKKFSDNKQLAAVQPKLMAFYKKHEFEYAGAAGGFIDWLGYAFCRGRFFQTMETDNGQYNNDIEIFWASGACMFVRADVYHQLGGLDASFFAHHEEIDLCWRMKNAGYSIQYCHETTVYHVGGSSLAYGNPRKTYLNYRNNLIMMFKNYYSAFSGLVIFYRMLLDGVSAMKLFFTGHFKDVWAILMAHVYLYLNFKDIIQQRRQTKKLVAEIFNAAESLSGGSAGAGHYVLSDQGQTSKTTLINVSPKEFSQLKGVYKNSIVFDYFFRRKKKFSELKQEDFQ